MTIDFNVPGYDIGSEQRRGIEMVVAAHGRGSNGFLLADEMGSGKTLQSLVAMRAIDRRTLVCCPASIVPQWEEKAAEVFPAAEVAVAKGAKSEGAFTDDARLVVISHDLVGRRDNRQVAIDWLGCDGVVVLDECHRMASTGKDPSRRSEAFWGGRDKTDTGIATGRFVLAMSGTPAPNGRHREYHRFLAHVGEATRDWWSYAKRYCGLKKKQVGRDTFVWDEGANSNRREMLAMLMANGVVNVVLDLAFMVVYLWVMWFYSPFLTKVVLASLLAYSAIAVVMGPVIRRRVRRQYERQAANQGYMVETVKAIRTLKSSALEPSKEEGWGRRLADYSNSSFSAALAGNYGSNAVQLVSKLTTVALLALGALEVIDGRLTVGALVAFNMLSQRVSQPVLRLAQLWQELQEVRVALKRLSDLMESPTEDANTGTAPSVALQGRVEFDRVGFRYPNRDREALRDVSFSVEPGQVVGVVGRSGSGKSTLVALLQRFYHPTTGRILVDGHNLSGLRPSWLRRQMGVVLQDNELFDGTVADNIALTDPSMPFSAVEAAARLACAHGFITDELGNGYQTMVGEGGSQLSGGQRQRVAIARALAGDPRILILDEATSALDSESAAEFRANLPQICQGRTAFIVTHNLAMLANCDLVLVIEGGTVIERGTPDELAAAGGRFATLQRTGKL